MRQQVLQVVRLEVAVAPQQIELARARVRFAKAMLSQHRLDQRGRRLDHLRKKRKKKKKQEKRKEKKKHERGGGLFFFLLSFLFFHLSFVSSSSSSSSPPPPPPPPSSSFFFFFFFSSYLEGKGVLAHRDLVVGERLGGGHGLKHKHRPAAARQVVDDRRHGLVLQRRSQRRRVRLGRRLVVRVAEEEDF